MTKINTDNLSKEELIEIILLWQKWWNEHGYRQYTYMYSRALSGLVSYPQKPPHIRGDSEHYGKTLVEVKDRVSYKLMKIEKNSKQA